MSWSSLPVISFWKSQLPCNLHRILFSFPTPVIWPLCRHLYDSCFSRLSCWWYLSLRGFLFCHYLHKASEHFSFLRILKFCTFSDAFPNCSHLHTCSDAPRLLPFLWEPCHPFYFIDLTLLPSALGLLLFLLSLILKLQSGTSLLRLSTSHSLALLSLLHNSLMGEHAGLCWAVTRWSQTMIWTHPKDDINHVWLQIETYMWYTDRDYP